MKTLENTSDRPFKFNAHGNLVILGTKKSKFVLEKKSISSKHEDEPERDGESYLMTGSVAKRVPRETVHEKLLVPFDPKRHSKEEAFGHLCEVDDPTADAVVSGAKHRAVHKGKVKIARITDAALEARARELAEEMVRTGSLSAPKASKELPASKDPEAVDPILSRLATVADGMKAKTKASQG